jgi:hypothetical protein
MLHIPYFPWPRHSRYSAQNLVNTRRENQLQQQYLCVWLASSAHCSAYRTSVQQEEEEAPHNLLCLCVVWSCYSLKKSPCPPLVFLFFFLFSRPFLLLLCLVTSSQVIPHPQLLALLSQILKLKNKDKPCNIQFRNFFFSIILSFFY